MSKKNKILLTGLVLLFSTLVVVQHLMPKTISWDLNFDDSSTMPYGCKVTKELLSKVFTGKEVATNSLSFYAALQREISDTTNLIIISDRFDPDKFDLSKLLDYAANGNNVFISVYSFSEDLLDTLKFKTKAPLIDTTLFAPVHESLNLNDNKNDQDSTYTFNRKMPVHFFESFDSLNSLVLGSDRDGNINFIVTQFGKGKIYLHCQPLAFTNYHILYGNFKYASEALAYLPLSNTIWDQYYKPYKFVNISPVRYILSQSALRAAYFIVLTTILVYMVIGVKRKQRAIPVIQPLQNTTLNFIKTVGRFYYRSQNHTDLARKKIIYFNEFLRSRYYMKTIDCSDENIRLLTLKSGIESNSIKQLLQTVSAIGKNQRLNTEGLIELHQMLENFYKKCN